MRDLPHAHPGTPDVRSPARYLLWLVRSERRTVWLSVAFGMCWMGAQALLPALIGRAIDEGLIARDTGALLWWSAAVLLAGMLQAAAGIMTHRTSVFNWLAAAFRTIQALSHHATRLGATLPKRVATGEVVSVGATDVEHLGGAMEIIGPAAGAITAFVVVAVILLSTSVTLGLLVLIGVPVLLAAIAPLVRPLQRRQAHQRGLVGELSTLGGDIVSGLRVLRGIGGEDNFAGTYREASQRVRGAGLRAGRVEAVLDAAQVLLPGVFVVALTWIGARFAVEGRVSIGELVAFYGYAAFLVGPLRLATETTNHITRALVAARRAVDIFGLRPELDDPEAPADPRGFPPGGDLVDPESGLVARGGDLTAIAGDVPAEAAALADRLGRFAESEVTVGGIRLADLALAEVRRNILVSDTESQLFSGVLREELDPGAGEQDPAARQARVRRALETVSAQDILEALPDGLDTEVEERGRSFSGGQRQRIVLARALLAETDVLVLVEPTSAVDAHTEARIADRLRAHRGGRTTIVATTSPLVLDRADRVAYLKDGTVLADDTHAQLLRDRPDYRALVTRGEEESDSTPDLSEVSEDRVPEASDKSPVGTGWGVQR